MGAIVKKKCNDEYCIFCIKLRAILFFIFFWCINFEIIEIILIRHVRSYQKQNAVLDTVQNAAVILRYHDILAAQSQ